MVCGSKVTGRTLVTFDEENSAMKIRRRTFTRWPRFGVGSYRDDVPVAADAADRVAGGGGYRFLFLFTLILLLRGLVAFIGAGVALGIFSVCHQVYQALQRRAQFPLFIFFEAVIQSFVDHDTQWVNDLTERDNIRLQIFNIIVSWDKSHSCEGTSKTKNYPLLEAKTDRIKYCWDFWY